MTKQQKPGANKKNKAIEKSIEKQIKNFYGPADNIPVSMSAQQAEEMKARIAELEAKLAQTSTEPTRTPEPAAKPVPRSSASSDLVRQQFTDKNTAGPDQAAAKKAGRTVSLRAKLTLAITVTAILAMGIVGIFEYVRFRQTQTFIGGEYEQAEIQRAETQILNVLNQQAQEVDTFFADVDQTVTTTASYTSTLFSREAILSQGTYWDALQELSMIPGDAWDNPDSDPASVFLPNHVPFPEDENIVAEVNSTIYLDMVAPNELQANPNMVALYYISKDDITIYYPNIDLANLVPADQRTTELLFFSSAAPESNPERRNVWTPPYEDPAGNGLLVTNSGPVYDQNGAFRGVIGADVLLATITSRIEEITLGDTGFAFLIDPDGRIIAMPEAGYSLWNITPEVVPVNETPQQTLLANGPAELQPAFQAMIAGENALTTVNYLDTDYYIAYTPIPSSGYSLGIIVPANEMNAAYLQAQAEVASENRALVIEGIGLFLAGLAGAIILSFLVSRVLTSPLELLTNAARKIASGDLEQTVNVKSRDEIAQLAGTFNTMTSQIRELIGGLEQRVDERTHDLELASEVGRTVTQKVANMNEMLTDAAEMIRARFNLYYTQVYLVDASGNILALRAGTGQVGEQLLKRGHRLAIGPGSLNGRAAADRKAIIVADTAESGTFLPNPLLPKTRSEMVVPLTLAGQVIGVLDMQSETPGALNENNLTAFEALAGQLSVAVQNARLFAEGREARDMMEANTRRDTESDWQDFLDGIERGRKIGYAFDQNETVALEQVEDSDSQNTLHAPITVTGATIGSIQAMEEGRDWTPREKEILQATAAQLAQHVESLRLLAQAERYRSEAEQAVRRLTREGWNDFQQKSDIDGFTFDGLKVEPLVKNSDQPSQVYEIKVRDEPIGQLGIVQEEELAEEERQMIAKISEQLGAHIENLRLSESNMILLEETEERAQREKALREITSALRSSTDPATIIRTAVREVGKVLSRKTVVQMASQADTAPGNSTGPDSATKPAGDA